MAYIIEFSDEFERIFKKLKKKDDILFKRIKKKLLELVDDPTRFKQLRNVMAGYSRIQFGSYVLVFKIDGKVVRIISLDHHDKAYKK